MNLAVAADVITEMNLAVAAVLAVIDVDVVTADAVAVVLTSVVVSAEDSGNLIGLSIKREQKDLFLPLSFLLQHHGLATT